MFLLSLLAIALLYRQLVTGCLMNFPERLYVTYIKDQLWLAWSFILQFLQC